VLYDYPNIVLGGEGGTIYPRRKYTMFFKIYVHGALKIATVPTNFAHDCGQFKRLTSDHGVLLT